MKDMPFTISPSVSNLTVHAHESRESWIDFVAWFPVEKKHAHVRFTLQRSVGVKMCGMGGEVGSDSFGEVVNSKWLAEINAQQLEYYPEYPDNFKEVRHFYIQGHDTAVEFLAEGFSWEIVEELPNWLGKPSSNH